MRPELVNAHGIRYQGKAVRHMVALGASAGGLHSLIAVLAPLPTTLEACIAVVTHLKQNHISLLPALLARRTGMHVEPAVPEPVQEGCIFVAPPGFHLAVNDGRMELLDTPPVRFLRPNIDILFESVAASFGPAAIGVVLSGTGHDGANGIRAIKAAGGTTITEDPSEAEFNDMPLAAQRTGAVDYVLPLDRIGGKLIELCSA